MEPVSTMKKHTINDVARISGVGKATVSRVFSNSPLVSDDTREKVKTVAKQLGYRPNPIARALTTAKTRRLTIVVPNIRSFVMAQIVRGAMHGAIRKGYSLFVLDSGEDTENKDALPDYASLLHDHASEGVIFCHESAGAGTEQVIENQPTLFLESSPGTYPVDAICTDNRLGMELLVRRLFELGHRKIGGVFGRRGEYALSRYENLLQALGHLDLPFEERRMIFSNWGIDDGYQAFNEIMSLTSDDKPTAILYVSDFMAMGGLRAAADRGVSVPGEVSIAGTDDAATSSYLVPRLTTLSYDPYNLGIRAADMMILRIEDGERELQQVVVPVSLKERESTGQVFRLM